MQQSNGHRAKRHVRQAAAAPGAHRELGARRGSEQGGPGRAVLHSGLHEHVRVIGLHLAHCGPEARLDVVRDAKYPDSAQTARSGTSRSAASVAANSRAARDAGAGLGSDLRDEATDKQDHRAGGEDQGSFLARLPASSMVAEVEAMPNLLANDKLLRRVAAAICGATTLDEAEPWVRLTEPNIIEVHASVGPEQWLADPSGRARYLSAGAVLFNLRLAIRCSGLEANVRLPRDVEESATLVATILVIPGAPPSAAESRLFAIIDRPPSGWRQRVHRVSHPDREGLEQAAGAEHATLRLLSSQEAAELRARIAAEERELAGGGQAGLTRSRGPRPDLGVLITGGDGPHAWVEAGQALQRVMLTAAGCGLAAVPLYQPIEVHDMLAEAGWWPGTGTPQVLVEFGPGRGRRATSVRPVAAVPTTR